MDANKLQDGQTSGGLGAQRITYSVAEAAAVTGLGRTTLYSLIGEGLLPSRKIGNRRLIRRDDLIALIS